jgi:hypothetical protein
MRMVRARFHRQKSGACRAKAPRGPIFGPQLNLYLFRSGSFALSKRGFGVGLRLANSGGMTFESFCHGSGIRICVICPWQQILQHPHACALGAVTLRPAETPLERDSWSYNAARGTLLRESSVVINISTFQLLLLTTAFFYFIPPYWDLPGALPKFQDDLESVASPKGSPQLGG